MRSTESPSSRPRRIPPTIPESEAQSRAAQELREAFARYFSYRADRLKSELKELFRVGRRSLTIGITVLAVCLFSAHFLAGYFFEAPFRRLVEESLLILGWVANWRPIEIFFYDWWPIARRRDLYRRLATATVEIKTYSAKQAPAPIWRSQA
jgi:hypothetical protein